MNKNYVFAGIGVVGIVIVIAIIGFTSMSTSDIVLDNAFNYQIEREDSENLKTSLDVIHEVAQIIQKRDCIEFVEWYKNNKYSIQYNTRLSLDIEKQMILESYNEYCEDPNTVLDENGIDVEEKWDSYYYWDKR